MIGNASGSERGIIHRDLKPANIKLTHDCKVKLLDFGLAKARHGDNGTRDGSDSPTLSVEASEAGVILGTAAYMSPQQAMGKAVDRRTDIWSFGVVLFEMLTGRQMLTGETTTEILAAVIRAEPAWTMLPKDVPPRIRELLKLCLVRDDKRRLRDIGDARLDLENATDTTLQATSIPPPNAHSGACFLGLLLCRYHLGMGRGRLFPPHPGRLQFGDNGHSVLRGRGAEGEQEQNFAN